MLKLLFTFMLILSFNSFGATQKIDNLKIQKIRAVGNYHSGDTYDDTIELWFTTALNFSDTISCTQDFRVYINTNHTRASA